MKNKKTEVVSPNNTAPRSCVRFFSLCSVFIIIAFAAVGCAENNTAGNGSAVTRINAPPPDISYLSEENISEANTDNVPVYAERTSFSFIAAGDNITYFGNTREAAKFGEKSGRDYSFLHQYTEIESLIKNADIAFINQETLMSDSYAISYYPRFNTPREMGHDIIEIGFDIINVANNHMLDWGARGLIDTINFLRDETDAFVLGDYLSESEYTHKIYEEQGVKIAFLSYTYGTNSGLNDHSTGLVIPNIKEDVLRKQIPAAKAESDLVFVSVHWGDENMFTPNERQKYYASLMCELGVDAIIGHHPHVIQPVEWLESENGHKTLCVYSLGNLAAEMARDFNMIGGLIAFDVFRETNGTTGIENVQFIPTMYYFNRSFYENRVYLFSEVPEELVNSHGVLYYSGATISYDKLMSYIKTTIPPAFLPHFYQ